MTNDSPAAASNTTPRGAGLALASLMLVFAGFAAYMLLLENSFLRRTAALTFVCFAVAVFLASRAFRRDRRFWVRGIAGATLVLALPSPIAFFILPKLPAPQAAAAASQAPTFVLNDHANQQFSLAENLGHGPVLITFYRGWW